MLGSGLLTGDAAAALPATAAEHSAVTASVTASDSCPSWRTCR